MSLPPAPFVDVRRVDKSSEGLLQLVATSDREPFRQFYERMSPRVLAMALAVVPDPARAEKITEQVFVDVWWRAAEFVRSTGSADSWVTTLTRARIIDELRHRQLPRPTKSGSGRRLVAIPASANRPQLAVTADPPDAPATAA